MKTLDSAKLLPKEKTSVLRAAELLSSTLPVSQVILFGSKARGTADEYSDIDLLVLTSCPVETKLRGLISEKLAEINLEEDVQLSSIVVFEDDWYNGLISYTMIRGEVEKDGCEIWTKKKLERP